jgi:hypothetical protein
MNVACGLAGPIRGEKSVFITHILGSSRASSGCAHAGAAATAEAKAQRAGAQASRAAEPATKHARSASTADSTDAALPKKFKQAMLRTYMGLDMPFSASEAEAIQAQALRAIVSTNSAFGLFEDPEMLTLIGMMRSLGPEILPSGKVVGGSLLNKSAAAVESKLSTVLTGQAFGVLCVHNC